MKLLVILIILFSAVSCQDDAPMEYKNDYMVSLLNAKEYQKIINILTYKESTTENILMLIEAHAGLAGINVDSTLKLIKKLDTFKYDDFDESIKDVVNNVPKISENQYSHILATLNLYAKLEKSIRNNNKDLNFKFMIIYLHKLVHDVHVFSETQNSVLIENKTIKESLNEGYSALLLVSEDIFKIKVLGDYSYKKLASLSEKLENSLNKILLKYSIVLEYPKNTENFYDFFTKTIEMNEQFAILLSSIALINNPNKSFLNQINLILKNQSNLNSNGKAILSIVSREYQEKVLNYLYNKQETESEIITDFKSSLKRESETFLNYEMSDIIKIIKTNEKNINIINNQL